MKKDEKALSIKIETDTKEIDIAIEKVKELVSLLERADKLIQSLGNTVINNYNC